MTTQSEPRAATGDGAPSPLPAIQTTPPIASISNLTTWDPSGSQSQFGFNYNGTSNDPTQASPQWFPTEEDAISAWDTAHPQYAQYFATQLDPITGGPLFGNPTGSSDAATVAASPIIGTVGGGLGAIPGTRPADQTPDQNTGTTPPAGDGTAGPTDTPPGSGDGSGGTGVQSGIDPNLLAFFASLFGSGNGTPQPTTGGTTIIPGGDASAPALPLQSAAPISPIGAGTAAPTINPWVFLVIIAIGVLAYLWWHKHLATVQGKAAGEAERGEPSGGHEKGIGGWLHSVI